MGLSMLRVALVAGSTTVLCLPTTASVAQCRGEGQAAVAEWRFPEESAGTV